MRLSEAIRLGATMGQQIFGRFIRGKDSCAWGAAYLAIGKAKADAYHNPEWEDIAIKMGRARCPVEGCPMGHFMGITHLNDGHRWTREQIADYVELFEPLPVIVPEVEHGLSGRSVNEGSTDHAADNPARVPVA